MATITQTVGSRTSLTVTGLSTLAVGTYCVSNAYTCNTNKPLDVIVEVAANIGATPAGNKQVVVFVKESIDGTNYRSGPESGTTTTDEPNLRLLGTIPTNTASTLQTATFSIAQALGYCPYSFKLVIKNDNTGGSALTAGTVYTSEISATSA